MKGKSKLEALGTAWKQLIKNDAQGVLISIIFIIIISCINGFNTQVFELIKDGESFIKIFIKQIVFLGISFFVGFTCYRFDYRKWQNKNIKLIAFMVIVTLLIVVLFCDPINGSRRWIKLSASLTIQPSEFAKLFAIIWAAGAIDSHIKKHKAMYYLESFKGSTNQLLKVLQNTIWGTMNFMMRVVGSKKRFSHDKFIPQVYWAPAVYALLTMKEPDMGTALLIIAFPILMTFMAGYGKGQKKYTYILGIIGMVLFFVVAFSADYRRKRMLAYYDPWSASTETGYQITQSILSISSGGFFGEGLTQGVSKFGFLPESHTDFAFAIWAQEAGFVGVVLVLALFMIFMYYGLSIARHSRDYLGQILATGLTYFIGAQALFNMAMVSGIIPVTGVPLPFISYGGSALVTNCAAIGILLNIARRNDYARKQIGREEALPSIGEETNRRFHSYS